MPRGVEVDQALVRHILELRSEGYSPRLIAEKTKLTHGQTRYILHQYGRTIEDELVRNPETSRMHTHPVTSAIKVHGSVSIEEGLNGGYIATVGDVWTGEEAPTWMEAINVAMVAAQSRGL